MGEKPLPWISDLMFHKSFPAVNPGTHLATLEEGRPSECVPPASLEANSLKKNSWGVLFTGIVGGTLVAVYAVATPFVTPALRRICLPFVPATTKQIENVVKMLQCRRGSLVDIGSGDGRIVSYSKTFWGLRFFWFYVLKFPFHISYEAYAKPC